MKLVDEIVELLSREQPNIEAALTKTKVLLYRLGQEELAVWVNAELNGYTRNEGIPDYRTITTRVRGSATDGFTRWTDIVIPLAKLPDDIKDFLANTRVGQGVATLQQLTTSAEDTLARPLSPEMYGLLRKGLTKGVYIESAHVEIGRSQIVGILAQIKSRLLDFVLQLSTRIPNEPSDLDMKEKSKEVGAADIFQRAIFGDNTTIFFGNSSTQNVSKITIHQGDFEALAKLLRANKVADFDINALKTAIEEDGPAADSAGKLVGPKVRTWMSEMMTKALDTAWQIELGVAGNLLSSAIGYYYGWN